jgi:hypothetical protein
VETIFFGFTTVSQPIIRHGLVHWAAELAVLKSENDGRFMRCPSKKIKVIKVINLNQPLQ